MALLSFPNMIRCTLWILSINVFISFSYIQAREAASMELGLGTQNYDSGFLEKLHRDDTYIESVDPIAINPPGTNSIISTPHTSIFLDFQFLSNDLEMGILVRRHHTTSISTYLVPGQNGFIFGENRYSIRDTTLGFEFGHTFWFLNDRLRLSPGYGYMTREEKILKTGFEYVVLTGTGLSGHQTTVDLGGEYKAESAGFFLRLGLSYDLSDKITLSGRVRFLPRAPGSFEGTSTIVDYQFLTDGTDLITSSLAGPVDRFSKIKRTYWEYTMKGTYKSTEHMHWNAGLMLEHHSTRGQARMDSGILFGYISNGTSRIGGSSIYTIFEPITDALAYEQTDLQSSTTFFFSVTFTSGDGR